MSSQPPEAPQQTLEDEVLYCAGHPKTPTKLRCSRCERPICGRCATPASVGQHCPWCVAEARKKAPKVRSAMRANAPVIVAILVLTVLFFVAQQAVPRFTERLFLYSPAIAAGEWWRLLTPVLLHAGILHIGLNSLALWIYGPDAEQVFGRLRFLVLYVIAGFVGNAVSYAFGSCGVPSLGASGAVFGVLGSLIVYTYNRRSSSFMGATFSNLLLIMGINLAFGFVFPNVNNLAHIGGLVAGIALAFGFDQTRAGRSAVAVQVAAAALVTGAGLALVLWRTASFTCG